VLSDNGISLSSWIGIDLGKAANFPYATINPEGKSYAPDILMCIACYLNNMLLVEARVSVPDARFLWLCDLYKPASRVPAFLTCIDIAGLTAVSLNVARMHYNSI
jgi:obg-like ATPase 1